MESKYFHNQSFKLESGEELPELELTYTTLGSLNKEKSNVVWVTHALTGNSNPASWWGGLIGDGKQYDPKKHFIVCVNVLGSAYGSTGPLSINPITKKPYFHTFPKITVRDIANSLELLRKHLQLNSIETLIGGSLGGQQAVEWAILNPTVFKNLVLVATNAKHSPWGIAFNESQRMAIKADLSWKNNSIDAGKKGLAVARSIALLSYRNYNTYLQTQSDNNEKTEGFNAVSYQQYQGQKFINRFNAFSYWVLSEAMDSHNVARRRESFENALKGIKAKTKIIAIETDILFPVSESELLHKNIPNSELYVINSLYGHDGFLLETELITSILKQTKTQNLLKHEY